MSLVLVASDQVEWLVGCRCDFHHGIVVHFSILVLEGFFQQIHNQICMVVSGAKDQGFSFQAWIYMFGQFLADYPVERFSDDSGIEFVNFHGDFIGGIHNVYGACGLIVQLHLFVFFPSDAICIQICFDAQRRDVVNRLPI